GELPEQNSIPGPYLFHIVVAVVWHPDVGPVEGYWSIDGAAEDADESYLRAIARPQHNHLIIARPPDVGPVKRQSSTVRACGHKGAQYCAIAGPQLGQGSATRHPDVGPVKAQGLGVAGDGETGRLVRLIPVQPLQSVRLGAA